MCCAEAAKVIAFWARNTASSNPQLKAVSLKHPKPGVTLRCAEVPRHLNTSLSNWEVAELPEQASALRSGGSQLPYWLPFPFSLKCGAVVTVTVTRGEVTSVLHGKGVTWPGSLCTLKWQVIITWTREQRVTSGKSSLKTGYRGQSPVCMLVDVCRTWVRMLRVLSPSSCFTGIQWHKC